MAGTGGGVLALDLSTHLGWAYGLRSAARPRVGVWTLPPAGVDILRTWACAENAVLDAITVHQPSLVVIEAPLPIQAQTDSFTAELMLGMDAVVRTAIWRHEIPVIRHRVSDVRRHALGTTRIEARKVKQAVAAHCNERGWQISDHNAADAALLWLYERDRGQAGAGRRKAA